VRVEPFPAKTFPTRQAAKRYELELLVRRAQGDRYVNEARTLCQEIDSILNSTRPTAWTAEAQSDGGRTAVAVAQDTSSFV
jgi:hypothetical protein